MFSFSTIGFSRLNTYFSLGIISFFFFLLSPSISQAQFASRIRTARPSVTMGTYTIGKNVLQWQTGLQLRERQTEQASSQIFQYKTVIRLGILEHWEVNGGVNYQKDQSEAGNTREQHEGLSALRLGTRYHFFDGEGFLKAGAIQGRFWIPVPNDDFHRPALGGRIMASIGYRLAPKLGLITNAGWRWSGDGLPPTSFFSLRFSQLINKQLVLVADYFSPFKSFEPDYALGIGYHLAPSLKLDIAIGLLGQAGQQDRYIELGFATRLDWRRTDS